MARETGQRRASVGPGSASGTRPSTAVKKKENRRLTRAQLAALIKSKGVEPPLQSDNRTVLQKEWNRVKDLEDWEQTVFWDDKIDEASMNDALERIVKKV